MKTVLPCAVMLLVVLSAAPGYPGPLALYDDFNAGYIDPGKWFGVELEAEPEHNWTGREAGTQAIRQVQDNRLRLLYEGYGRTNSNSATNSERLHRELNLIMQDSTDVKAIQATVEVTTVTTTGCPNSPDVFTVAWARLGGRFFTATNSTNGKVGDVVALIHLGRRPISPAEPPNVLHAVARVFHCFDEKCTDFQEPLDTPTELKPPVLLGQKVKLLVQWDKDNERFIFQRDSYPEVEIPYKDTLTFSKDSERPNKALSATLFVPNCTHPFRPAAFIDARFDDVMFLK